MPIELPPLSDDLDFLSPMSGRRAAALVEFLAREDPAVVVDVGCGWGELLLRAVEALPEGRGLGVDSDEDAIGTGRRRAAERGLAERVIFVCADGAMHPIDAADTLICVGASHVWAEATESVEPIPYAAALAALRSRLGVGDRCVYGEGIWSTPPTSAAIEALGGRADEFVDRDGLAEIITATGFEIVGLDEATLEEWDEFESGFTAGYERWLEHHDADHPDAAEVTERLRSQRSRYLRGYRGVMGMAYARLVAT